MKQVIKNNIIEYETINIRQNTPTLEYLKERNHTFRLQHVNHEKFIEFQNATKWVDVEHGNFIVGFAPLKGNHFRSSGGLKLSDPTKTINGSFIIEEKRIIYDAAEPFFEERDAFVYSNGPIYYTEMTMIDILREELKRKRRYLIYMGEEVDKKRPRYNDLFEEVSKEELLEYATNPEKGEEAYSRRRYF